MNDLLRFFLEFSPVIINICCVISFILLQFGLLLDVRHSDSVVRFCHYLIDSRMHIVILCVVSAVLSFVCYELFIWNWGSVLSLVFMFVSYYLFPLCAAVVIIIAGIKLVRKYYSCLKAVRKGRYFLKSVISSAVCTVLLFIVAEVAGLPCASVCFAIPFLPVTGIFVIEAGRH